MEMLTLIIILFLISLTLKLVAWGLGHVERYALAQHAKAYLISLRDREQELSSVRPGKA